MKYELRSIEPEGVDKIISDIPDSSMLKKLGVVRRVQRIS